MSTSLVDTRINPQFVKCERTYYYTEIRLLIKHAAQPDMEEDADENKGLQLSQFEMAQLANLSITDIDEARTLIPTYVTCSYASLATKDDTQLESLLHELSAIRSFT